MKLQRLTLFFALLGLAGQVFAQSPVALETRQSKLRALSVELHKRDVASRRVAEAFARKSGIPSRRKLPNGGVLELQRIAPGIGCRAVLAGQHWNRLGAA